MKPLLIAVQDGQTYKLSEIATMLAQQYQLNSEDLSELLPSGRTTVFKNRVSWARTYLKKAGLVDSPARSMITITDAGKKVVLENPPKIDAAFLEQFPSFRDFTALSAHSPSVQNDSDFPVSPPRAASPLSNFTPDDQLESAYQQINASLAADLLSEVIKINSYTFEKLVIDLLSKMGYGTVEFGSHTTAASGDDGIDGVIMEDRLGFSLIYIQAKQWALDRVVGQPEIQSFVGAIAGKHGDGLFVTTARYSQKAKDYAQVHHIILIDGEKLANLMIESNFCVSPRKTFEIKDIDFDALSEYQE